MLWHEQTIFIYVAGHFRAGAAQAIVKHQLQMVLGREEEVRQFLQGWCLSSESSQKFSGRS